MRLHHLSICVAALVMVAAGSAAAADTKAPRAVTAAIQAAYPGAHITSAKAEKEEIDQYEVEFTLHGKKLSADVAPDGTIIETEEPIEEGDVPEAVRKAVQSAAEGGQVKGYEKVTVSAKADKDKNAATKLKEPEIQYEAALSKDDMGAEVAVTADGKVVEAPKWKKRKSK